MLSSLKVKSIRLMTNNPSKIAELEKHGIAITERVPLTIPPNAYNQFYLETKALKSGHLMDLSGKRRFKEQSDLPIVEGMSPDQLAELEKV